MTASIEKNYIYEATMFQKVKLTLFMWWKHQESYGKISFSVLCLELLRGCEFQHRGLETN